MKKKMESKIVINLIKRILVDRAERDYSLFYLEIEVKKDLFGLTTEEVVANLRAYISLEIENSDFSFFFYTERLIIVAITAKNLFGLNISWKTNLENKLILWFCLREKRQPVIRKIEENKKKVIKLIDLAMKKHTKEIRAGNTQIVRHSETDLIFEKELSDYVYVTYFDYSFYHDSFNKFPTLENMGLVENNKTVAVNIINCYFLLNGIAVYRNCLLKKNVNNFWEYYGRPEFLLENINEIIFFIQKNLGFYAEYIDVKKYLVFDYNQIFLICKNAGFYLKCIDINSGVSCVDGYFTALDKFYLCHEEPLDNFLVSSTRKFEEMSDTEKTTLLEMAKKIKLELDSME